MPQIKDIINQQQNILEEILKQTKKSIKSNNFIKLKRKQGEIYKLVNTINKASSELVISSIIFIISIIIFFDVPDYTSFGQIFPIFSILYSLYEILVLVNLSYKFYSYNKQDIENEMDQQIKIINRNKHRKYNEFLINLYNENEIYIGKESKINCHKNKIDGFYKTAYLIIKNNKNKFFIYNKIVNYEKSKCIWKPIYYSDETIHNNLLDSLILNTKKAFGLKLNKNNLILLYKYKSLSSHQIIEFILANENLDNSDIDYNIDQFYNAKFISSEKYFKYLKTEKIITHDIYNILIEKILNYTKKK